MTTSDTNQFNLTRNQIISMALERIGVKTLNRNPTNAEIEQGARFLNSMIKAWKNLGINLWKSEQGYLFTQPGQKSYKLDGTTAYATQEYSATALAADAIAGATSIVVDDVVGFSIGYFIVIAQDDNTNHFTTISNIVGTTITLAAPLTANATTDNYVYAFETKINRPEGINNWQAFITPTQNVPGVIYSNNTYFNIPTPETPGIPNVLYYDKQLNFGTVHVWPVPNVNTYFVRFTFQKQYDDFITANNTPDFPQEWLKALYLNLAYDLCGVYGKTPDEVLKRDAHDSLEEAQGYDREDTSIYFQPATTQNIYNYR
jgi:hypothetical protein